MGVQWQEVRSVSIKVHRGLGSSNPKLDHALRHPHRISHQHIGRNTEHHALQQHTIELQVTLPIDTKLFGLEGESAVVHIGLEPVRAVQWSNQDLFTFSTCNEVDRRWSIGMNKLSMPIQPCIQLPDTATCCSSIYSVLPAAPKVTCRINSGMNNPR